MTQEEKAKRYDLAIEVAEKYHNGTLKDVMETIFPELAESEDERIRKALIEAIRHNYVLTGSINHIPTKDILAWLEKLGEQKGTNGNEKDIPFSMQKPADKVEPKFHEDDWVIGRATENEPRQIAEITEEGYKTTYGGWIGFSFEEDMRLWTIQDAKDGDVLADRDRAILLFRGVGNNEWSDAIEYYALLETNMNNRFSLQEGDAYWGKVDNCSLCPATKKQRDALMKAMAEAGYEWDPENRELKKIDHKELTDFQEILRSILIESNGKYDDNTVIRLSGQVLELVEQKPAEWSKEDEAHIDSLLKRLEGICKPGAAFISTRFAISEDKDWLKSLKDRYTWKPSDEQIEALDSATENCAYSEYQDCLRELIGQLKKLREE